jgi:hypothetical protein
LIPEWNGYKERFSDEEAVILRKLQRFLKSQQREVVAQLNAEIEIADDLIANHCERQNSLSDAEIIGDE